MDEPDVDRGEAAEDPRQEAGLRAQRDSWFMASRMAADGPLPAGFYSRAVAARRQLERGQTDTSIWIPIGPSVVTNGQASGRPPVSGRVNALAVGPGGSRVYAGAANGGLWFSGDAGASWTPLDDSFTSPHFTSGMATDSLSVGTLAVRFSATPEHDQIFVGTGEPHYYYDRPTGDGYFGVGIRHSAAGGLPGTWQLEATNLASHGIFALAMDPDHPRQVFAASSIGLYRRPTHGNVLEWQPIHSPAFTGPNQAATACIIAGRGHHKRYYAAFWGDKQVYRSHDGETWQPIPGIDKPGRTVLAAAESDPTVVYVLTEQGALYRLVGDAFVPVTGVPRALFYGGQGDYDIVLAVDPHDANTVYLAGDLVWDGNWTVSFYKGTITGGPDAFTFPFNPANDLFRNQEHGLDSSHVTQDPTWIGRGVHADAHSLAFATNPDGSHDPTQVWIGTDGGLFHSSQSGARSTFVARNTGLAITEMTYLAQHPANAAVLLGGCQDNGTLRRTGGPVWHEAPQGDGGGAAIDPQNPYRVMRQYVRATLEVSQDGGTTWDDVNFPPVTAETATQGLAADDENRQTMFYGRIAVSPPGGTPGETPGAAPAATPTQLAFGTHRVWLSSDWGKSWVTLPSGTNPYAPALPLTGQDVLDDSRIQAVVFSGRARLFAATAKHLWRFDRTGEHWQHTHLPTDGLPEQRFITAIAPAEQELYITLGGGGVDHVWHFDGLRWQSAGLSHRVLDVPASAVVVDPEQPTVLYVGTDAGVWRGQRTGATNWDWQPFSRGLPEAAVTDLVLHEQARLLRAATHGRGVWEVLLHDHPAASPAAPPDLYLRASLAETGRRLGEPAALGPAGLPDPLAPGRQIYPWLSPDLIVRPAGVGGLPPVGDGPDLLTAALPMDAPNLRPAAIPGSNRVYVQVHNRSEVPLPGAAVRVLLLATPAAAGLPALPADWAAHLLAGDTNPQWLAKTGWRFADAVQPYRTLPGLLAARTPQVVTFVADTWPGQASAAYLALVTSLAGVPALATKVVPPEALVLQEPKAALQNGHLLLAPLSAAGDSAELVVPLRFHNATAADYQADLVIERSGDGADALTLGIAAPPGATLQGWRVGADGQTAVAAEPGPLVIAGVTIPAGGTVALPLRVEVRSGAQAGQRFRLDVLQRRSGQLVGGAAYVIAVVEA